MLNRGLGVVLGLLLPLLLLSASTPLTLHSLHTEAGLWVVVAVASLLLLGRVRHRWRPRTNLAVFLLAAPAFYCCQVALVWRGDWMTQTVLYEHRTWPGRTIEFQMMNPGPGSYQQRTVERQRLLPGLEWLRTVGPEQVDTTEWKRVNKEVNELGFTYA